MLKGRIRVLEGRFRSRRFVPRDCQTHKAVDRFVRSYANLDQMEEVGSEEAQRLFTWVIATRLYFHYNLNYVTATCYVYVSSDIPKFLEAYVDAIQHEIPCWSFEDLTTRVDSATDPVERGWEIQRMAIASPYDFDERAFERVSAALASPDNRLRAMSAMATRWTPHPQYRPWLTRLSEADPDAEVRRVAAGILEVFDLVGVPTLAPPSHTEGD